MTRNGNSTATISLFGYRELDTLALGQTDPWLLLSNDEHVALPCRERVVNSVFDMYDVETSVVTLTVGDYTDTPHIATTRHHGNNTSIEAYEVCDLASRKVDLDSIIHLDSRIWIPNSASVMRDQEWDSTSSELYALYLPKLVFSFSTFDTVNRKAAFSIVNQTEVLASLFNRDDVHVASRVCGISANFAINLYQALHNDLLDLAAIKSIFETIPDEDNERKAISEFMRTWGRTRSIRAG